MGGRCVAGVAALLVATALYACGGGSAGSGSNVVARVGDETITKATLAHWTSVLKGGIASKSSDQEQTVSRRALELLISRQWLIGAAADHGLAVSPSQVQRQIARTEQAGFPGGVDELNEYLKSTGQTTSDLQLQARAELASDALRRLALDVPAVTDAQIAAYYAQHKRSFLIPERREARYAALKRRSDAEKLRREVEAGRSLTTPAQRRFHEEFTGARFPPGDPHEAVIDSLKPHVVSGPFSIERDYWVYELVRVIPARQQTLAEVRDSIRRKLSGERRRNALAAFTSKWTTEWIAKTDCRPGYVVQRCRQFKGQIQPEISLEAQ